MKNYSISGASLFLPPDGLITGYGPFRYTRTGPAGAIKSITDSALYLTFGYDTVGRLSSKTTTVNQIPVFKTSYNYDGAGRISGITETISGSVNTYSYIYDADGQLTERMLNGNAFENYSYDLNGNRTGYTHSPPYSLSQTASFDAQDRIVELAGTPYLFDVDGYLIHGNTVTNCEYSSKGELLSADAWGASIGYTYDGLGRRVARSGSLGTHQYFYANLDQPFQVSAVRDPTGVFSAYYYDPTGVLYAFKRGNDMYYVASDHLGTPRVVTNAAGLAVKKMEYDSYGYLMADSNPSFDLPIGFAGGIPDTTGLVRFGFRDYEPGSGRWVSRDPILYSSQQANLYQYVQNDPGNKRDPFGLWQISVTSGIGLGGQVTIGHNSGQWNFGAWFGVGEGLSVAYNPNDSGCKNFSFDGSLKGEGQIGLGANLDATSVISVDGKSSADMSLHVPGTPLNFGVSNENISIHGVETTFSLGESGFIGLGGTAYFGAN